MSNPIVTVNVSQQLPPAPSLLQKSGTFISQGGTNTAPGTKTLLTQLSDLVPVLQTAKPITSLAWSGSVVTATTTSPHGYTDADTLNLTIAGAAPSGYDGTFLCTITGASTFTYPLASNPGMETTPGTYIPADAASIQARANTFFAQGSSQAVWILEIGAGNANDGVTFLTAWITANPGVFYSYLVPRFWDGVAAFVTFVKNFTTTTAKTYFFVTTTLATYSLYATIKSVFALIEAPAYGIWAANALTAIAWSGNVVTATTTTAHGIVPGQWFQISGCTPVGYNGWAKAISGTTGETLEWSLATNPGAESALGTLVASQYASAGIPSTEFSCAAPFQVTLNYAPSSTNRVTTLNNAFLFGVTVFPTQGNAALLATLNAANVNIVGTGAQGGLSALTLIGGNMMDGNPFNYWYSVDWTQITGAQAVAAAVINGANNPQNPLYYNQDGINVLQQVLASVMASGLSFGLVLNPIQITQLSAAAFQAALNAGTFDGYTVVNADPFANYTTENPDDYATGTYNGLSVDYVPLRGFESITFNISVSSFAQ